MKKNTNLEDALSYIRAKGLDCILTKDVTDIEKALYYCYRRGIEEATKAREEGRSYPKTKMAEIFGTDTVELDI